MDSVTVDQKQAGSYLAKPIKFEAKVLLCVQYLIVGHISRAPSTPRRMFFQYKRCRVSYHMTLSTQHLGVGSLGSKWKIGSTPYKTAPGSTQYTPEDQSCTSMVVMDCTLSVFKPLCLPATTQVLKRSQSLVYVQITLEKNIPHQGTPKFGIGAICNSLKRHTTFHVSERRDTDEEIPSAEHSPNFCQP